MTDADLRALAEAAAAYTPPPFDEADDMCENCVTPWKCNGPHVPRHREPTPAEKFSRAISPEIVLGLCRDLDAANARAERAEAVVAAAKALLPLADQMWADHISGITANLDDTRMAAALAALAAAVDASEEAGTDPDADNAPCGCGAIGVAAHTNAQHYGALHAPATSEEA